MKGETAVNELITIIKYERATCNGYCTDSNLSILPRRLGFPLLQDPDNVMPDSSGYPPLSEPLCIPVSEIPLNSPDGE